MPDAGGAPQFAPIDGTRRAVIFGAASGPLDPVEFFGAMVIASSRGDAVFDLGLDAHQMSVALKVLYTLLQAAVSQSPILLF